MKYLQLHVVIWIYSLSSVLIKMSSLYDFFSIQFLAIYALIIIVLGIYALLWQQMIKKFEPSIAYSNKSVTTIWTMIYAIMIFGETISIKKIIGILLILAGIVITTMKRRGN